MSYMGLKEIFDVTARYCEDNFGIHVERDEDGSIEAFECPECGEPLYACDWCDIDVLEDQSWTHCPVCDFDFEEGVPS